MFSVSRFRSAALAGACAAGASVSLLITTSAHAEEVVAVTQGSGGATVFTFDSANPANASAGRIITGFSGTIEGIDYRPVEGSPLYMLTRTSAFTGSLYTLDPVSGAASFVTTLKRDFGQPIGLNESFLQVFGDSGTIDFDPVSGGLVYLTTQGFPLAFNPQTGVLGGSGSPGLGQTPLLSSGLAFSNNDNDPATGTTAYTIDTINNRLLTIGPNGVQAVGSGLGIDPAFGLTAELDYSGSGTLYGAIALQGGGGTRFFTIDPVTGLASSTLTGGADNVIRLGGPGGPTPFVRGIAVRNVTIIPEPDATAVFGVAALFGGVAFVAGRRRRANGAPAPSAA